MFWPEAAVPLCNPFVKKFRVLISKRVSENQEQTAHALGWMLDQVPALRPRALSLPSYETPWDHMWWMITSTKALPALLHYHEMKPITNVGCTAPAVRARLIQSGITPKVAAHSAQELSKRLLIHKPHGVVHLCAKHSRKEAGQILRERGIEYLNIPVYETVPENHCIRWNDFDAWMLLSPRSLEAFACQLPPKYMPVAAIGNTTANTLKDAGFTRIFVPSEPDIDCLITEFHAYLKNNQ